MNHLISVIVPVYNVETYLTRCIDSIINQSYSNLEIILINDGSTDSSGNICDTYAENDKRIKVYHIKNGGSSIARNYGLKRCSGDYIGFVDSDDWIKRDMFKALINFSSKHNLEVVECAHIKASEDVKAQYCDESIQGEIENKGDAIKRIIKHKRFAVWRRLYRRSILENRFFIKNILHQDVYFTIDILNNIDKVGYLKNKYYVYNVENPNSVIRSDYSLKKLNSINAASYVVENTKHYNNEIKSAAIQYLFEFLTSHYNSLYKNPNLDPVFEHRKKIKATFKKYHNFKEFNFYAYLVTILPSFLYKIFLKINAKRVNAQLRTRQILKNV